MAGRFESRQFHELATRYAPYTKEEEAEVTDKYFHSDHGKWRELIVLHNMRFCLSFSERFFGRTEDKDDIIMSAVAGMFEAADRFDPSKGYRFTTYCAWHMMHSLKPIISSDAWGCAKTDRLTSSILDRPFKDHRKDSGNVTFMNFVGRYAAPDHVPVDPSAQYVREFGDRELDELVDHLCRILADAANRNVQVSTPRAMELHRNRVAKILTVLRMRVGGTLYGRGLSHDEISERVGITKNMVKWYILEGNRLLTEAFERGMNGTGEYLTYHDDFIRIFKSNKRKNPAEGRQDDKKPAAVETGKGFGRTGERAYYCRTFRVDGSDFNAGRGGRRKLTTRCSGIQYPAPTPWMKFPAPKDSESRERHIPRRTLRLPETCASCVHRPACSSWLGGCEFCKGKVFRKAFSVDVEPANHLFSDEP